MVTPRPGESAMIVNTEDPGLVSAIEANLAECLIDCVACLDGDIRKTPEVTLLACTWPDAFVNGAFLARFDAATADAQIDTVVRAYDERHSGVSWWVGPNTRPTDLGARLATRGFERDSMPGMAIDLTEERLSRRFAGPELVITQPTGDDDIVSWVNVMVAGSSLPDEYYAHSLQIGRCQVNRPNSEFAYFIGAVDGRAVCVSCVYLDAGIAGIYSVATLADARRRGYGAEVTMAGLRYAAQHGYRVGALEASALGEPVYRRMGFRTVGTWEYFVRVPTPGEQHGLA